MELPAEDAEQSVLLRVTWEDAAAAACVMEPASRHLRPVASAPPKPAAQPPRCVELPAEGAEHSVLLRVAWEGAAPPCSICAPWLATSQSPLCSCAVQGTGWSCLLEGRGGGGGHALSQRMPLRKFVAHDAPQPVRRGVVALPLSSCPDEACRAPLVCPGVQQLNPPAHSAPAKGLERLG